MGLFGSDNFLSSLYGGTDTATINNVPNASVSGQGGDVFFANYFFPQMLQYLQASAMTGEKGQGMEMFSKLGLADGYTPTPSDFFKIAQQMTSEMPALQAKLAEKNAQNFQKTYDTMSKIPALSDIFSKASGNVDSTGALAKIFGDLSGSALGGAASSGFLTDPTKQANVLGPLALQKYQMEQSIQQNAQAQALGLSGAGGLAGSGLFGSSLGGSSQFIPGVMNAAGMFGSANLQSGLQASLFNNSAKNQMASFNSALLPPVFGGGGGDAQGLGGLGAIAGAFV